MKGTSKKKNNNNNNNSYLGPRKIVGELIPIKVNAIKQKQKGHLFP